MSQTLSLSPEGIPAEHNESHKTSSHWENGSNSSQAATVTEELKQTGIHSVRGLCEKGDGRRVLHTEESNVPRLQKYHRGRDHREKGWSGQR